MKVWLLTIGEPVPVGEKFTERLHRTGYFAQYLAKAGHEVVWWTSAYDHFRKSFIESGPDVIKQADNLEIRLLRGCGYKRNVSYSRIRDHQMVARQFSVLSRKVGKPDIVLSSFPAIELSREAVRYGKEFGVPVVVDVRDLWPDIFLDNINQSIRWLGRIFLDGMFRQTKAVFRKADGVVGVSEGYMQWGLRYAGRTKTNKDAVFPLGYPNPAPAKTDSQIWQQFLNMGVSPDKHILLFIGTMGQTYDLQPCILAADAVFKAGGQLVFCGTGENMGKWRELAKFKKNIVFTGWLDQAQIGCILSRAYLGLAAYAKGAPQGLPNKIFEYISNGIPIISSLQGEARDFISKYEIGATYEPRSVDGFRDAVVQNMSTNTRARLSVNARNLFLEKFVAEKVYADFQTHLLRIVADSKALRNGHKGAT